jgi:hypothetical protein
MHIIAGAILALVGAAAVAYIARGASSFEHEPPLLALGVLLVATGVGLGARSRAAGLAARIGIGASLLAIVWVIVKGWLTSAPVCTDEGLVRYAQLFGFAVAAALLVAVFLLVHRARGRARFGPIDIVPIAGLAAALVLGTVWLLGSDSELRPCRLGNDLACQQIATRLLESAERAPSMPPTAWEERAARVLDAELCPMASEPGPCGLRRYAVGSVALRAGRRDAAKLAFRQACDFDRSWCARAVQEQAAEWTPAEQARLQSRARP